MESLTRDLRYVARSLARSPGFFVVTALTLALGIGATTAIFSVVNGVLLQPLPYPSSDRIIQVFQVTKSAEPQLFGNRDDVERRHDHGERVERAGTRALDVRVSRFLHGVQCEARVGPDVR